MRAQPRPRAAQTQPGARCVWIHLIVTDSTRTPSNATGRRSEAARGGHRKRQRQHFGGRAICAAATYSVSPRIEIRLPRRRAWSESGSMAAAVRRRRWEGGRGAAGRSHAPGGARGVRWLLLAALLGLLGLQLGLASGAPLAAAAAQEEEEEVIVGADGARVTRWRKHRHLSPCVGCTSGEAMRLGPMFSSCSLFTFVSGDPSTDDTRKGTHRFGFDANKSDPCAELYTHPRASTWAWSR